MMAQTGGLLVGAESDYKNDVVFAKIEHATFSEVPVSGTPITIEACADGLAPEGGWIERYYERRRHRLPDPNFS